MYVAIDPGLSGGVAWRAEDGFIHCFAMPDTPMDIYHELDVLIPPDGHIVCFVEKVGFHRQGNSAASSATFARHCGHLEMALLVLEWEAVLVTPSAWMRSFLGKVPKERKDRKNAIKAKVQQRCPYLGKAITLKTADAVGILLSQLDALGDEA